MERAPKTTRLGRSEVIHDRRELLVDGVQVPLGSRAFDILELLIEARGMLVTKDEILDKVWAGVVVEENNLQVHMSALRKALETDRGLIRTVTGRGYRLLNGADAAPDLADEPPLTNLPNPTSELIGRDQALADVLALVAAHRIVTLTGLGGIGKTRIAVEAARRLAPRFADGAWFAELAPVASGDLVLDTVATALGIEFAGATPSLGRIVRALGSRRVLLVLDNCEHVIDRAAEVAEAVVQANPNCRVLATSREPLRAEGEWIYPIPPLEVPAADARDLRDWRHRGAVGLFFARALAAEPTFSANESRIALAGAVCRRLDGIPLAIELAAARVAALGIEQLAVRLDERFSLLTGGRRTALPRHQTMRATLDWSFGLLAEPERVLLGRLAIFAGPFTLEAACVVAASPDLARSDAIDGLLSLVGKSLVASGFESAVTRYRLLETTRAYAREKLTESGTYPFFARRHAEYHVSLFERASVEYETSTTADWLAEYSYRLDDVRAALDWAFAPDGDAVLGVTLAANAVPLWLQFSLMTECRRRAEQALDHIGEDTERNAGLRMRLSAALGTSRMYLRNPPETILAAWSSTLALAERLGDSDYRLRAIWGLFASNINIGNFQFAVELARRFRDLATDAADRLIGERLVGNALHFVGDQTGARQRIERMLAGYASPTNSMHIIRFQSDQTVGARRLLAPILWVQGFPDQAMQTVSRAVADALAVNHDLTLCNLLAQSACPLALLTGDLTEAERLTELLIERAVRQSLDIWHAYGRFFKGMLLMRRGDLASGLPRLRDAGDELRLAGFMQYHIPYLAALAEGLGRAGEAQAGIAAIEEALARAGDTGERWCLAELLRIKGELLLQQADAQSVHVAEQCFASALDVAREQGALSWELRVALSVARLRRDQGRSADGMALLRATYDRFTEGFETADLRAAQELLGKRPRLSSANRLGRHC